MGRSLPFAGIFWPLSVDRRKVLDYCVASGALVMPGHVGLPFAGRIEKTADGYRPHFAA